jgi:predicted transglutaminase-like cysteine proteinase
VQKNILYVSDNETKGMLEYWRYPVETLVEKKGDCEDTAILFASILDALGYEVVLLFYILDNETGHLSVGIHLGDGYGEFIEDNSGKRYYYCETTNSMYQIGEIPSNIGNQPDDIIAI